MNRPQHSGLSITLGIVLIILGFVVLGAQVFTTLFSVLLLGWILIISGAAQVVYGLFSGSWMGFFIALIGGAISFTFGLLLAVNPEASAATLTLLIGILLLVGGGYKLLSALFVRSGRWGWVVLAGLVSLLLGTSILAQWPYSGLWVIGLFIGIELIISGFALIASVTETSEEISTTQTPYLSGAKGGKATTEDKDYDKDFN